MTSKEPLTFVYSLHFERKFKKMLLLFQVSDDFQLLISLVQFLDIRDILNLASTCSKMKSIMNHQDIQLRIMRYKLASFENNLKKPQNPSRNIVNHILMTEWLKTLSFLNYDEQETTTIHTYNPQVNIGLVKTLFVPRVRNSRNKKQEIQPKIIKKEEKKMNILDPEIPSQKIEKIEPKKKMTMKQKKQYVLKKLAERGVPTNYVNVSKKVEQQGFLEKITSQFYSFFEVKRVRL